MQYLKEAITALKDPQERNTVLAVVYQYTDEIAAMKERLKFLASNDPTILRDSIDLDFDRLTNAPPGTWPKD